MRPAPLALLLTLSPSLLFAQPLAERTAALGTTIVTSYEEYVARSGHEAPGVHA